MNQQVERLKSGLHADLLALNNMPEDIIKLTSALEIIDDTISKLSVIEKLSDFESPEAEKDFYKRLKPEILACRIEQVARYQLSLNLPIGTTESKLDFYKGELKARQSFFLMNAFHYQYYKNGLSDLDNIFFSRSDGSLTIPITELSETDHGLAMPMTCLFAKFIAYEHIQYFILEQIANLEYPENQWLKLSDQSVEFKWTGDVVNIVELAYGLWLTGQLNNGNASLNQIVRWLESSLHVNIGIIQRRFTEIQGRKRLSPTKYIDQMKEAILKKIKNDNS